MFAFPVQILGFILLGSLFTIEIHGSTDSDLITSAETTTFPVNIDYFEERHRFESLIAAGRLLSYPYSIGFMLALVSNDRKNWNVSLNGLSSILDLTPEQLLSTYSSGLEKIKEDGNVTVSSVLYSFRDGWKDSLEKLGVLVKKVVWNSLTWNDTWEVMNDQLVQRTNGLMDGKLIPTENSIGDPFPFSTQATILSTFHYKNCWNNSWTNEGLNLFGDSGNVPYLKTEGDFLFEEAEDFTAISVPFLGHQKSIVFILPKINITKFFRKVSKKSEDRDDFVPFPKHFTRRYLSISVPAFNLTDLNQYGKELEELGMNQTFCTTIQDRKGRIPYYIRPIVQSSAVSFTQDSFEVASASGTAVEKFYLGLDVGGNGYPRTTKSLFEEELGSGESQPKPNLFPISVETDTPTTTLVDINPEMESYQTTTTPNTSSESGVSITRILFNKPFLFYLDDVKLGPMFYGIVEKIEKDVEEEMKEENSRIPEEALLHHLWSCKSFKHVGEIDESSGNSDVS